jgi:ABC-type sugar transport system ATPase subunit
MDMHSTIHRNGDIDDSRCSVNDIINDNVKSEESNIHSDANGIFIDNINLQDVSLYARRKCMCIIPQDPVLFSGTVRMNLDPVAELRKVQKTGVQALTTSSNTSSSTSSSTSSAASTSTSSTTSSSSSASQVTSMKKGSDSLRKDNASNDTSLTNKSARNRKKTHRNSANARQAVLKPKFMNVNEDLEVQLLSAEVASSSLSSSSSFSSSSSSSSSSSPSPLSSCTSNSSTFSKNNQAECNANDNVDEDEDEDEDIDEDVDEDEDIDTAMDEKRLMHVIERCRLKPLVDSFPTGLNHVIESGGENLSVGQRQLFCLARALLRLQDDSCKILCLDEATANVDHETDALIQSMIRTEFWSKTVITVAHRLKTVVDYDVVMVMERGVVAEYGPPGELIAKEGSIFKSMWENQLKGLAE